MALWACALGRAWVMQHCCVLLPGGICRRCHNMSDVNACLNALTRTNAPSAGTHSIGKQMRTLRHRRPETHASVLPPEHKH